MFMTGNIMLFYIVFHIAHLTFGENGELRQYNVYNNFVGFSKHASSASIHRREPGCRLARVPWFWSMFQTLGANHPRYNHLRKQGNRDCCSDCRCHDLSTERVRLPAADDSDLPAW